MLHNHKINYNNSIKFDNIIWSIADQEITKSYILTIINYNFYSVKWVNNCNKLKYIKITYLDLKIVYNANKDL